MDSSTRTSGSGASARANENINAQTYGVPKTLLPVFEIFFHLSVLCCVFV